MHLLIPFASALSEAAVHVLRDLPLPNLGKLVRSLAPSARDDGDEYTLSPPHERALAALWGWHGDDGELPFGARAAAADGIATGDEAWGLLTPAHWHVGRDHVTLVDPAELKLDDAASHALVDAVRSLFDSEGFRIEWGAADRWHVSHPALQGFATASLDRVIGRNVDLWMRGESASVPSLASREPARQPFARLIRRLQSECQLLLYPHPINERREARGELPVNSFWLSGCGRAQPMAHADVQIEPTLRAPMLAGDWTAWAAAWARLDAGPLARLADALGRGVPVSMTLCGERSWQRFERRARSWRDRMAGWWARAATPQAWLEAL